MVKNPKIFMPDTYPHDNYFFEDLNKVQDGQQFNYQLQDFLSPYLVKDLVESNIVVFYDCNKQKYKRILKLKKQLKLDLKLVLIRTEPRVVLPLQYKEKIVQLFDLIIDFGTLEKNRSENIVREAWPVKIEVFVETKYNSLDIELLDKAILLASNKNNFLNGNLYFLRKKVVDELFPLVDVCGDGWKNFNVSFLRQLLGAIYLGVTNYKQSYVFSTEFFRSISWPKKKKNRHLKAKGKINKYKFYKVVLVIENSSEYLSEKFFEALASGRPVVYVGTDLGKWKIPPEIYLKADVTVQSIRHCIQILLADAKLRETICLQAQKWLQKESTFDNFSMPSVYQRTAKLVKETY